MKPRVIIFFTAAMAAGALLGWIPAGAVVAAAVDAPLADAVQRQDAEAVRALLVDGADVNLAQADGATALAWAVHWDDLQTVRGLIAAGADVDAANDLGVTPLMLAAQNASAEMVRVLISAGADPNISRPTGDRALMIAARTGNVHAVRELTRAGASVNARMPGGHTALMWAAAEGHADVAQALIDAGAGLIDVRTTVDRPPQRSQYGMKRELRVLREGEATNPADWPRDGDGDPARAQGGFTPLLYAVLGGHLETVGTLLDGGANVNEAAPDGVSPLMLALAKRHEDLALMLVERGADPNYDPRREVLLTAPSRADGQDRTAVEEDAMPPDYTGYSALHVAAATSQHRAMQAILAAGGDPNTTMERPKRFIEAFEIGVFQSPGSGRISQVGSTPFMLAAKSADAEGMRILAEAGADPFATTADGTTALALAAGYGKRASTDITYYEWNQTKAIEAVRYALELGIDINSANEWGGTALHGAAYHGADDLVRFLVENGADMNATDWEDQTPLRLAKGHMICCTTYLEQPTTAALLLELGADPEAGSRVTFGLLGYNSEDKDDR